MSESEALHEELKKLIVETLALEDVTPSQIETDAPLFGDGLDLDSIDALEIAMVLEERFHVIVDDDPEKNQAIFASIRSIATFIAESRAG